MPWNSVQFKVKTASGWEDTYVNKPTTPPATGLIWAVEADSLRGTGLVDLDPVSSVACLGAGGNATQSGTPRPLYRVASLNGHDTFQFDGTNDCFIMPAAALSALKNLSSAMVTVVYKVPATLPTGTRCLVSWSTGTTTGARVAMYQNITGSLVHQAAGRRLDADAFGSISASVGSVAGASEILTADYRWTSSDLLLYKNGDTVGSNLTFQTAGSTSNTDSLTGFIGTNAAGSSEFFSGEIAGIYVYSGNDTTGTTRSAIHSYIHNKFGVRPWDMPAVENISGYSSALDGYAEDFPTTVAVAQFTNMTTGDKGKLVASGGGAAAGTQTTYALSFKTAEENSATSDNAFYSTVRTTSIAAGTVGGGNSLYIHEHVVAGVAYGGKFKPLLPFGADENNTTYARYLYTLKFLPTATTNNFAGVFDLINPTTWSTGTGEYGHPENGYFSGNYSAFIRDSDHVANPNRAGHVIQRLASTYGAPSGINAPHLLEIRTQPGRTQLIIHEPGTGNSYVIWDDTVNPVSDPLGFVWQCGAPGIPGAAEVGDVEIPWCTISPWIGGKGLPDQGIATTIYAAGTPILDTDWEFATVASPISNANMWTGIGGTVGNNTATFDEASIVDLGAPHNKVINHFNASGLYIDSSPDPAGLSMYVPLTVTADEATITYDLRFTTPDAVTASNPWGKGGKLPGLCGIAPGHGNPPSGGTPSVWGWSGRAMWVVPSVGGVRSPVEFIGYLYDPLQTAGQFGQYRSTNVGWESGGPAVGDWVEVKQYYKMNTVTVDGSNWSADGIHRIYFDGVMVYEKTNQVFRRYTAGRVTHMAYDVFYGGGDVTWAPTGDVNIQIDNLLITTP